MLEIRLSPHSEFLSPENAFDGTVVESLLLSHQRRTAEAVPTHPVTVNTYATGTGKTVAALLGWLAISQKRGIALPNMLFIAPTNELIAQHIRSIEQFADQAGVDIHAIHVDAASLRALPTPHNYERVGERLNRLIENPQDYGYIGRKPMAMVTNPDIFYYALFFSAYNPIDRRNLFERFLLRFDYVVIDEFHYYSPKQLTCFLFFLALCKQWGYFEQGRRVCLLSATPEPEIQTYLGRLFDQSETAWITPEDESSADSEQRDTPTLTPLTLRIISGTTNDFAASNESQALLRQWLNANRDGALISDALWRINVAHTALSRAGFESYMARLTGAERIERRRDAPRFPLLLATPTVDIGYNFDKPGKSRQPLDFIIFEAGTRDAFLQRLGRAGRVLGRSRTDVPSDGVALVDDETYLALADLDGRTLTRTEFAKSVREAMRPRFDLYAYLQSHAVFEVFRPIFNLERMTRPDLHGWIERLFELVRDTLAPGTRRHRHWSLRDRWRFHQRLERIVMQDENSLLSDVLDEYVRWHTDRISDQQTMILRDRLARDRQVQRLVRQWAEEQYHLTEALFNFREAFQTPTAFIFDPKHLLSDSDTTLYDALHVAANFEADWFISQRAYEKAVQSQAERADIYCHLKRWRETRLIFDFEVRLDLSQERFEQLYTCRLIALHGLLLRGRRLGEDVPFPIDQILRQALEKQWLPALILRPQDEGRVRALLHGRNISLRYIYISFADKTEKYPAIVGTAAFIIDAELERYMRYRERSEDNAPIIV